MTSEKGTGTLLVFSSRSTFLPKFFLILSLNLSASVFPAAVGQSPLSAVWALLLLLWFLVGEVFPESPGLL